MVLNNNRVLDLNKLIVARPYDMGGQSNEWVVAVPVSQTEYQDIFSGRIYFSYNSHNPRSPYVADKHLASNFFGIPSATNEKLISELRRRNDRLQESLYGSNLEQLENMATDFSPTASRFNPKHLKANKKAGIAHIDFKNIDKIKGEILGQDAALTEVINIIKNKGIGFRDSELPIASFLFTGPSGVGKSQTAKEIAKAIYGDKNKTFRVDMSTFHDKHSMARFVGSELGYEGSDVKPGLVRFLEQYGEGVIILDEIEKGHEKATDVLMEILQEGEMKTAQGDRVNFKNCFIICTSNATVNSKDRHGHQIENFEKMTTDQRLQAHGIKKEIIGRFSKVVDFAPLTPAAINAISKKLINEKVAQFNEFHSARGGNVELNIACADSYIKQIQVMANTAEYGARDLKKALADHIETPTRYLFERNPNLAGQSAYNVVITPAGSPRIATPELIRDLEGKYEIFNGKDIKEYNYVKNNNPVK
ncbi:MAG: AAA family ATPase [Firmicutes bacterium]|nr:AAA family ATPase [Bacillota bacterium]